MTTKKTEVCFEVHDPAAMRDYCRKHSMSAPVLHSQQIHGGDYYRSAFEVWQPLYCNLPYNVMGCYAL